MIFLLRKSRVKEHLRHEASGKTVVVKEHDDKRQAKPDISLGSREIKVAKRAAHLLTAGNPEDKVRQIIESIVGNRNNMVSRVFELAKKHQGDIKKSTDEDEDTEKSLAIVENLKDGVKQAVSNGKKAASNGELVKSVVHSHLRRTKNGSVPVREYQDGRTQRLAVNRNHALTHIGQLWRSGEEEGVIIRSLYRTYGLKPQEAIDMIKEYKKGRGIAKAVCHRLPSGALIMKREGAR